MPLEAEAPESNKMAMVQSADKLHFPIELFLTMF